MAIENCTLSLVCHFSHEEDQATIRWMNSVRIRQPMGAVTELLTS
jgi:hypothetical protein